MARGDSSGQKAIDAAGNAGSGAIAGLLAWLGASQGLNLNPALTRLLAGVGFVAGMAFILVYRRYAMIITRRGPHERNAYDALRLSLERGGVPGRLYSERLRAILYAVDRFFGDAGMADRTLFPQAFGLRMAAPLWTAAAFDRCLQLALVYPLATIVVLWVVSGHVGPAEHALWLDSDVSGARRALLLISITMFFYVYWSVRHRARAASWRALGFWRGIASAEGWRGWGWHYYVGLAVAVAVSVAGQSLDLVKAFAAPACFVFLLALTGTTAGTSIVAGAIGVCLIFLPPWLRDVGPITAAVSVSAAAICVCGVAVTIGYLNKRAARLRWQGPFQVGVMVALALLCCLGAAVSKESWWFGGAPLIFCGLLTLVNAPFDWVALGLTRALLRRGLELGSWFPFLLSLVDALAAAATIVFLTIVSVITVQAVDDLAMWAGADHRVLPLDELLDGIATNSAAPEFWWVYGMLLSTMIPSLLNLMLGGASLARGVPWITKLLLHLMPDHKAPAAFNRQWITVLLTLQVFVGGALGIIAQGLIVYVVIWWLMPPFSFDLLELARAVAAPDWPGQAIAAVLGRH